MRELENPGGIANPAGILPFASRVVAKEEINGCCLRKARFEIIKPLHFVDMPLVLEKVRALAIGEEDTAPWMDCPIGDLVVHLMERCHRPLGARLLNLETVIDMVKESHTDDADDRTERIRGAYLSLRSDLLPHLLLEEDILFPCIISGKDTGSVDLIEDLQNQHKVIAKKMKTLAASVSKLPMSENTCEGRQTLYTVVKALEADVSCHIHFENDVFYVRVLRETWKRRNLEKQHAHHYR